MDGWIEPWREGGREVGLVGKEVECCECNSKERKKMKRSGGGGIDGGKEGWR